MTTELTGLVRFAFFVPSAFLVEYGCPDWHAASLNSACRACSVSASLWDALKRDELTLTLAVVDVHPEHGVPGAMYEGEYRSDAGRLPVARMMAWVRGDRDPLELAGERPG